MRLTTATALLLTLLAALAPLGVSQAPRIPDPPPIPGKFFTGAKPTPPEKVIESIRAGRATIHRPLAAPPQVIVVPKRLSYWGNNQYGVCVSSESAFSIVDFTKFLNMEEVFVTDAAVIDFARRHGWLNGANLLEVIEVMQSEGMKDEKGILRKAGKASAVDFANEETLKSAIAQGPVSIAIASGSLPSGAGNKSGWYAFGGRSNRNTDHCVSLHGYGPTSELFKALDTPMPANSPAFAYLLYTWKTIGVVDHQWLMGTCAEGWGRNPTVLDLVPPQPPPPPPSSITVAVAGVTGGVGTPVKFAPTARGGTSPYLFLFSYGDGVQDGAGTHTYSAVGSYPVTVTAVDVLGGVGMGTCTATISTSPQPPPFPPVPGGQGTITWTINGVTQSFELVPIGSRKTVLDIFGPMSP